MAAKLQGLVLHISRQQLKLRCVLQSNWPAAQYAAAVVTVHLAFALLEKQRLQNFAERGEVFTSVLIINTGRNVPTRLARSLCWQLHGCNNKHLHGRIRRILCCLLHYMCAFRPTYSPACAQYHDHPLVMQAGHFGQAVFDPAGLTDDYTRQAEVTMFAILQSCLVTHVELISAAHVQPACYPESCSLLQT